MARTQKRDVAAELQAMRSAKPAANDGAVPAVNPNAQMRRDLADVCDWYEMGQGWTQDELAELRRDYQAALQREPFDLIADILSQSAAVARAAKKAFLERVAADAAKLRAHV